MFSKTLLAAATLGSVSAAEWTLQSGTSATMVLGVGVSSETYTVAAAGQNGVGAEIESFNGQKWTKEFLPAGTLMDAAASDKVSVGVSMWEVLLSTDGVNYATAENIKGLSQSCSVFGDGSDLGLVGTFTTGDKGISGVAHSSDNGATWTVSEVPIGMVRYGSFPTKDTWYVTSGMWGDSVSSDKTSTHMSSLISVANGKTAIKDKLELKNFNNSTLGADGYWGAISKTTDGGATWNVVFHSSDSDVYYFNGISCSSETHCVAVAEGNVYVAFMTSDGGATWKETLTSSGNVPDNLVSMMGAAWQDDNNGWLAGVAKDGRTLTGIFFKTTDGGNTYTVGQELENCYPIDLDMKGTTGAAACLDSSGTSGYVAMYV